MFEPEIARRCLSCGASVRHSAAFCPQCGQFLEKRATDSDAVTDVQSPDPATTIDESEDEQQLDSESAPTIWAPALPEPDQPPTIDVSRDGQQLDSESAPRIWTPALLEPEIVHPQQEAVEPSAPHILETRPITRDEPARGLETRPLIANTALSNQTLADIPGPAVRRPGQSPPPVAERPLRDRVDKIRKVSSVMIDQAAYDPSFRFLLVAAVLFIIFLVLMLLSKVVG